MKWMSPREILRHGKWTQGPFPSMDLPTSKIVVGRGTECVAR